MVMDGPLAPWASGMAEQLNGLGYARRTAAVQMALAGKLSRFLEQRGLGVTDLRTDVIEEFLATVRAKSGSLRPTPKALAWLVGYLSDIGVTPTPTPSPPQSREEELVERYRHYLMVGRGLAPETVVEYMRAAVLFLVEHPGRELDAVGIGDVSRFMTRHCRLVSQKSVERLAPGCGRSWVSRCSRARSSCRWRVRFRPRRAGAAPRCLGVLLPDK